MEVYKDIKISIPRKLTRDSVLTLKDISLISFPPDYTADMTLISQSIQSTDDLEVPLSQTGWYRIVTANCTRAYAIHHLHLGVKLLDDSVRWIHQAYTEQNDERGTILPPLFFKGTETLVVRVTRLEFPGTAVVDKFVWRYN